MLVDTGFLWFGWATLVNHVCIARESPADYGLFLPTAWRRASLSVHRCQLFAFIRDHLTLPSIGAANLHCMSIARRCLAGNNLCTYLFGFDIPVHDLALFICSRCIVA